MKDKHKLMYMRVAEAVAATSSARRLQVGAVAVKNNMVIGTGYNGLPGGVDGECEVKMYQDFLQEINPRKLEDEEFPYTDSDGRYKLITKDTIRHAEANLLLNLAKSTESSEGAIIFCTHACCKFCAMDIVDAGIKKVYYRNEYRSSEGIEYLIDNGVEVEKI
jgi:dCMP deaminase